MSRCTLPRSADKVVIAHRFADRLVRIENNIEAVISLVFRSFHELGFKRVRLYLYKDGKCVSWRCCTGHVPTVRKKFQEGRTVLSPSMQEQDNFASMEGEKIPLIIVFDPRCTKVGQRRERGRQVFMTNSDPWYAALGKPQLKRGERFEWLDCPLLIGYRILGKITMDTLTVGKCFDDTDLALTAPLSFLVASALERNPLFEYDVFLSFHNSRWCLADLVKHVLEQKGLSTFLAPQSIEPGKVFQQKIREGILRAKEIVALYSPECRQSHWVHAECASRWLLGKDMTVFRVDGVQTEELPFFMRDLQSRELTHDELIQYADRRLGN